MSTDVERTVPSVEQIERELNVVKLRKRFRKTIISTVAILIVIAASAYLIASFILPVIRVYSDVMQPALDEDELLLCFNTKSFDRGDLIAFYYNNRILVRRVIGVPGDQVDIGEDGQVFVNGIPFDEPYVTEKSFDPCDVVLPTMVEAESYFVLGDNRPLSMDSRSESVGAIPYENIVGKVILRVWPLGVFGTVQ